MTRTREWESQWRRIKKKRAGGGVNRSKTSPETVIPSKRTTTVSCKKANLTPVAENLGWKLVCRQDAAFVTRTKISLEAGEVQGPLYFPSSSSTSYFWPTASPFSVAWFVHCFILRSCCSTGRQRAAMETWTDVGCICILSHAKLRLILKVFSGVHQQNQVNTHMQSLSSEPLHLCFIPASCTYKVNRTWDCLWKC